MRILLVEDHPPLAEAVMDALHRAGFVVDHARSLADATTMTATADYALVLLDLGLPDGDGLRLLPKLRRKNKVPVIVLTARDQIADRLAGLDGGADDYVVKPVEMSELVARCRAVLRRPGERSESVIEIGSLRLDTVSRGVTANGEQVRLSRRELAVLELLMRSAGRVVSRRLLEESVYGFEDEVSPNALEAAVSRLRKALDAVDGRAAIVTVRGVGWMLARKDEA
ncbi:MAG: response regulator transcription factor [Wenzhouxiangella sp.]|nr:response regulator transcription factor [Wenzhouxiangella sp.]